VGTGEATFEHYTLPRLDALRHDGHRANEHLPEVNVTSPIGSSVEARVSPALVASLGALFDARGPARP
jgi:hypothetical protein